MHWEIVKRTTPRPDGKCRSNNGCQENEGRINSAGGRPELRTRWSQCQARVTSFGRSTATTGLSIVAHDYSYAVAGEPKRDYPWILSRAPAWMRVLLPANLGEDPKRPDMMLPNL